MTPIRRLPPPLCTILALAVAAALGAATARAADDPALHGCWRLQAVRYTMPDGHTGEVNHDCVAEFAEGMLRTRCHRGPGQDTDMTLSWERTASGHLRETMPAAAAEPTVFELDDRLDGDWWMTSRSWPPGGNPRQPVREERLLVRVDTARDGGRCEPHGEQPVRDWSSPVSSLVLSVPPGWKVRSSDTPGKPPIVPDGGVPIGRFSRPDGPGRLMFVAVAERPEVPPVPVRTAEFEAERQRFEASAGDGVRCHEAERLCSLAAKGIGTTYEEVVVVRGRLVLVSATSTEPAARSESALRQAVRTFVERLRLDNGEPSAPR